jgi:hypothetical protein
MPKKKRENTKINKKKHKKRTFNELTYIEEKKPKFFTKKYLKVTSEINDNSGNKEK